MPTSEWAQMVEAAERLARQCEAVGRLLVEMPEAVATKRAFRGLVKAAEALEWHLAMEGAVSAFTGAFKEDYSVGLRAWSMPLPPAKEPRTWARVVQGLKAAIERGLDEQSREH